MKKASPALLKALDDIERIEKGDDIRRVASEMLLGLARKEVSATDVEAAAKMMAAQAAQKMTELKVAMWAHQVRTEAAQLYGPKEGE